MTPPGVNLQKVRFPADAIVTGLLGSVPTAFDEDRGCKSTRVEGSTDAGGTAATEVGTDGTVEALVGWSVAGVRWLR